MNAQQKLLEYAKANNNMTDRTDESWLGQAIVEGITKSRGVGSRIVVNIKRSGKKITVTETAIDQTPDGEKRISKDVLVVEL